MNTNRFILMLFISIVLSNFALAQSHEHHHIKGKAKPDSVCVKDTLSVASDKYICPMHPDSIYTQPGKCAKCGMTLQKMEMKSEKKGMPQDTVHKHSGHEKP